MAHLRAIPWRFQGTDGPRVWQWDTEHFVCLIIGEATSFQWEISDKIGAIGGNPVSLADGITSDFPSAETAVREVIGKSYAPTLGYREYAGSLATMFAIATGERIDFAQFHGNRVVVVVGVGGGRTQTLRGQGSVENYELVVAEEGGAVYRILPHRIRSIIFERGGYDQMRSSATQVNRMYRGQVTSSCTGAPGFMEDTVEHHGRRCPVHEYESLA